MENMEVIYSYTRAEALADGVLIDVSAMAKEAGCKVPVAVTSSIWAEYITPDPKAEAQGQSKEGRLWDVLSVMMGAIRSGQHGRELKFPVRLIMKEKQMRNIWLKALSHPGDNMEHVITIMGIDED